MLTIIFLLISTITDILYRKIYNFILIPMFLVSLYSHQNNLSDFFIALLISSIVILILYKLNFFAGGDAKLLIILGATVGCPRLFYLFTIIFIIGGLQALASKIFEAPGYTTGQAVPRPKQREGEVWLLKILRPVYTKLNISTKKHLPYALSIFLGYLILLLLQSNT